VAVSHVVPLVIMAVVSSIGVTLGLLLLVVPGILLAVCWIVMVPARVVERRGIFESMGRSLDLTQGCRWPILLLIIVYLIVAWILTIMSGAVTGALAGAQQGLLLVNVVVSPLLSVFTSVISSVGIAAIYFELRGIKEGVAHENLAAVFE
ncbi:MAG TPA: hypothetical protein VEA15_04230, partial [Caulobacteraceae bacterium]|nr:hypothetical protein [Caulobacteraceae bacterium]